MGATVVQQTLSQLPTNVLFTTSVLHTSSVWHTSSFTYFKLSQAIHTQWKEVLHSLHFQTKMVRLKGGGWRLVGVEKLMGDRMLPRPIDNTVLSH